MEFSECQNQFKYYLALEDGVFSTDLYASIDKENYKTFSTEYAKQMLMICSEIDMLLKKLCKTVNKSFSGSTITGYFKTISANLKFFRNEEVQLRYPNMSFTPWASWSKEFAPVWWTDYNKIKHQRLDVDETGKLYFNRANQENLLNALAALYIIEQYLLYFAEKEIENIPTHYSMFILFKSKRLYMKEWEKLYSIFMGSTFFDLKKLDALMETRI